ncbi:hypothetical protein NQZ68_016681 [Dissostichus eleginoides]|nr:hypothetical protein NQZ68_016681 [Dissostichus eleginoides]
MSDRQKHIFSSSGSPVPGLFFLEASNPGWSVVLTSRGLPPTPLSADVPYPHSHFLRSSRTPISALVVLPLTSEHLIKTDCLFWPAEGLKLWGKAVLSESVGWCGCEAANQAPSTPLIRSSPLPLLVGRRWALLRRWLKITGIFKAAEESQGRQRLDSLPPGRSSPPSQCVSR